MGATGSQDNLASPEAEDHTANNPPTNLEDRHAFTVTSEPGNKPGISRVRQASYKFKMPWQQKPKAKASPNTQRRSNFKSHLPSTHEEGENGRVENGCSPLEEGQGLPGLTSDPTGVPLRENKSGWSSRRRCAD